MAENKTKPTSESVTSFLNKIENPQLKDDCFAIVKMMQTISKTKPVMWGSSIIGFQYCRYGQFRCSDRAVQFRWERISYR